MSDNKTNFLTEAIDFSEYLQTDGILCDEEEFSAQLIRDRFPQGVSLNICLKAAEIVGDGRISSESGALLILAMVPVHGIQQRIWQLYATIAESKNEKDDLTKYLLIEALCYLDEPEGWKEFAKLKEEHLRTTTLPEHLAARWFKTSVEEIAQWKADRAAGKRWEREE